MRINSKRARRLNRSRRKRLGAAVVEMAIAGSMLVVLLLAMIDMGQFIMINQVVSNASRAAARHAARSGSNSVAEIQTTAREYLENSLPSVSSSTVSDALDVDVLDVNDSNATVTGTIDSVISSGEPVAVRIQFAFNATRWLSVTNILPDRTIEATTVMRRE